ncbi:MAG: sigma-54-dependent Fis family transcriptional regulator [Proteobacteria bacterium]|nr:sigma-54-dependent Fis family transcriptional regulator [Pseudomonadota bacterium]
MAASRTDRTPGSGNWSPSVTEPGRAADSTVISKGLLTSLGTAKLANIVLEACLRHEDVSENALDAIAKSGLRAGGPGQGHAGEPLMVGNCEAMKKVLRAIRRLAVTDAPVLITGESGTGKELTALAIHERSRYSEGPFVTVNCGGLPASLIATELFGHEKGAFTGAGGRRTGHIEAAEGGTLFLDEVGDLPLELQGNFLRFLEEKTIERVGSIKPIKVDARILAATNVDLEEALAAGRFRRDLFFRLDVLRIRMPPLRERRDDIEILTRYFIQQTCQEMNCAERQVVGRAIDALKSHAWPGNIRELISKVRRAVVMAEGEMLDMADFELDYPSAADAAATPQSPPRPEPEPAPAPDTAGLSAVRADAEQRAIVGALERNHYNVSAAANELGVSRTTMYKRMSGYGIEH